MKNKFLALVVIAITAFTACKKDEENASLQGKWALGQRTITIFDNNVLDTTYSEDYKGAAIIEFTATNKCIFTDSTYSDTLNYKLTGNTAILYQDSITEDGFTTFNFTISGNTMKTTETASYIDGTDVLKVEAKGNYTKK